MHDLCLCRQWYFHCRVLLHTALANTMWSNALGKIHFWGWHNCCSSSRHTIDGFTTAKEYAELEWPIDIAITIIWVIFGISMFGTIFTRRERHLYVAIWFI